MSPATVLLEGEVVDAASGVALPARVYLRGADGAWHFPRSSSSRGAAARYERTSWTDPEAFENYTVLSAHPFRVSVPPGRYTLTVERGKEYFPETRELDLAGDTRVRIELRRWIDMAALGWFSGDTHNHTPLADLPVAMLADDVNVVTPVVDWATAIDVPPTQGEKRTPGDFEARPVHVDATHVWHPRNTEYEISLRARAHPLGAFLILNHRTRFDAPVFPLREIEAKAHAEGALIDLEKHNWHWSMALVPLLKVDLFELANNHVWRAKFVARDYTVRAPAWMNLGTTGMDTERHWVLYGFETYYALLNCGFRLRPAAGTANGVHPVPLGFGRVFVHVDEPFSHAAWMRGLAAGRSFVTTGPMLFGTIDDQLPGRAFAESAAGLTRRAQCRVVSEQPLEAVELIVNGRIVRRFTPENRRTAAGALESACAMELNVDRASWVCWRAFEPREGGRFRFAHSAPWHLPVAGSALRPRREQIAWLMQCVEQEIARSTPLLPPAAIAEYRAALAVYRGIAVHADDVS